MAKPTKADADLLIRLYDLRREEKLRKARHWYLFQYDPMPWAKMKPTYFKGGDEDTAIRTVTSYWNMVAALVHHGVIDADLFLETNGEQLAVWEKAKGWVEEIRKESRPTYLRDLELLCERTLAWRKAHFDRLPHERPARPAARTRGARKGRR